MREEELWVARCAEIGTSYAHSPGRAQGLLGSAPEIEVGAAKNPLAEAFSEGRPHVLPDLVTARTDTWPNGSMQRAAAKCSSAGLHDSGQEASPARVEERKRRAFAACSGQCDRKAIRSENKQRTAGHRPSRDRRRPRPMLADRLG